MTFQKGFLVAAAVCFLLAALGLMIAVNLPLLGMCFFVLSFYPKTP